MVRSLKNIKRENIFSEALGVIKIQMTAGYPASFEILDAN